LSRGAAHGTPQRPETLRIAKPRRASMDASWRLIDSSEFAEVPLGLGNAVAAALKAVPCD
jgi:hypothetical protein